MIAADSNRGQNAVTAMKLTVTILLPCLILLGSCKPPVKPEPHREKVVIPELPENAKLEEALRVFGREDYAKARALLEEYSAVHTQQAPLLSFYIGECCYQMADTNAAVAHYERAVLSNLNSEEAATQLISIFQSRGNEDAARAYTNFVIVLRERIIRDASRIPEPELHESKQVMEAYPGCGMYGIGDGYTIGGHNLRNNGRPIGAARCYEAAIICCVPMNSRFSTGEAGLLYRLLSEAYLRKAAVLRTQPGTHLRIAEADQLAQHYRLKAFIVETRLASKQKK